jgi:hypothetical protein
MGKENIFWLEIRMNQMEVMQNYNEISLREDIRMRGQETHMQRCQAIVRQTTEYDVVETGRSRCLSENRKRTSQEARKRGIYDSDGRTS